MPLIAPESVDEVRQAADLVELVRGRVQLARRGGRWWGRCPFHDERTPSFSLIPPDNRRYYCHGCGASGDAITWMQDREGAASFAEAIEQLADRFGVTLRYERSSPEEDARRATAERRLELLDRAAGYYATYLWAAEESAPAREYLTGRGFSEDVLRRFRVGYAPASGHALAGRAIKEGFSRDQLTESGLARMRGGAAQDFFLARIMFPIADGRGRTLGFGGRTLDPAERAKYVNSPESGGFHKRELLFGLHLARASAARGGWTLVVEGYTDVLALHAAGVDTAVACMGTALTAPQLRLLARAAPEARLCFDADRAGQEAAFRTVEAAQGIPLRLMAVTLPAGRDPGDLAGTPEGLAELRAVAERPEPLVTWLIRARAGRPGTSPAERERVRVELEGLLPRFPDGVEKDEAVRLAVSLLGLSRGLAERLEGAARERRRPSATPRPEGPGAPARRTSEEERERRLLVLALALPGAGLRRLADVPSELFAVPEHRRAHELIVSEASAWPDDLAGLESALRSEAAAGGTEDELGESAFRVQEQALERRARQLRADGDEHELLHVLELLRRLREASRGTGA